MATKGKLKICEKGHQYYKSSDCPICPVCEKERKPKEGFSHYLERLQDAHWKITE